MLKKILIVLALVIVIFIALVLRQPKHFRVERTAIINASPEFVFTLIDDLQSWKRWSPWIELDPQATLTYEGPSMGTGAAFNWSGNKKVGAGRLQIIESKPTELVRYRLDFEKPFKATNSADFTLTRQGEQTRVTWGMEGDNNFFAKAFSLFVDCDKMIGRDFEKGFANMNAVAAEQAAFQKAPETPAKKK